MTDKVNTPQPNQSAAASNTGNGASKKTLIGLLVAFILPVVLAKLALEQDWFNRAATNKGELLQPTVDVTALIEGREPKWRMIYVMPENCGSACENAIYSMQQVWIALGRETDRVEALTLITQKSDRSLLDNSETMQHVKTHQTSEENVNKLFKAGAANGIFIVDTQNNAMLKFDVSQDKEQAIMESRDMLSDIKKLLKLSRIG